MHDQKVVAIIPAAGKGIRFNSNIPKQFVKIQEKPILIWTIEALQQCDFIDQYLVVLPRDNFSDWCKLLETFISARNVKFIEGGSERWESVWRGLCSLSEKTQWVIIHDGARPLVTPELVQKVFNKAIETEAAICGMPSSDTVKNVKNDRVCTTLNRTNIWLVQTPQIFSKNRIIEAYKKAIETGWHGTDDASFMERAGYLVHVVLGDKNNIKITTQEDMEWLEWYLSKKSE